MCLSTPSSFTGSRVGHGCARLNVYMAAQSHRTTCEKLYNWKLEVGQRMSSSCLIRHGRTGRWRLHCLPVRLLYGLFRMLHEIGTMGGSLAWLKYALSKLRSCSCLGFGLREWEHDERPTLYANPTYTVSCAFVNQPHRCSAGSTVGSSTSF